MIHLCVFAVTAYAASAELPIAQDLQNQACQYALDHGTKRQEHDADIVSLIQVSSAKVPIHPSLLESLPEAPKNCPIFPTAIGIQLNSQNHNDLGIYWLAMFQRHTIGWQVGYATFGILAWGSLAHEVWSLKSIESKGDNSQSCREPLWDVAKFLLMCSVWLSHCAETLNSGSHLYYSGWFMAAFFFLSGLASGKTEFQIYVRRTLPRALRDNVLNVMFLASLTGYLTGRCSEFNVPWFLNALFVCRILIDPCLVILSKLGGGMASSVALVAACLIAPWLLKDGGLAVALNPYFYANSWWMMQGWFFYALGIVIDPQWLARSLKTRGATFLSIAAVGMVVYTLQYGLIQASDVFVPGAHGKTYDNAHWQQYLYDILAKLFCIGLFLGCLAPLTCRGNIVTVVLMQLGQRSLYGYMINLFFWSLFRGHVGVLYMTAYMPAFADVMEPRASLIRTHLAVLLAASVAMCPLSEWCVRWLVSPQWIFDIGGKVISLLEGQAANTKLL